MHHTSNLMCAAAALPKVIGDPNRNSSPLPWQAVEQVAPALSLGVSAVLDLEPSHMRVVMVS